MIVKGEDGVENLGTPIHFLREPGRPALRLAAQGADTDDILQWLGYDAKARESLRARKVV
jgi:crotonobetainyl-CoA:carnitine CoA-transferase CaiB-like acyl-CoA transferase